jgi:hypothetical protein
MLDIEKLKFPIGKHQWKGSASESEVKQWITEIELLPSRLNLAVKGLNEQQLNTPYRPEGWTVRQVIHHIADSHINSYIRYKLATTEDNPTIKPYMEDLWAKQVDYELSIEVSLKIIEGIHARWVALLKSLSMDDLKKTFYHPERKQSLELVIALSLYAWHSNHHLAHIVNLKERMRW